jgi:hypothetical protein
MIFGYTPTDFFTILTQVVAKGALFEKLRFSIINLTIKILPKQDEFSILG